MGGTLLLLFNFGTSAPATPGPVVSRVSATVRANQDSANVHTNQRGAGVRRAGYSADVKDHD